MKKYCPECGFANQYELEAPINCSKCKKSMSFEFKKPEIKESQAQIRIVPRRTIKKASQEIENEDDLDQDDYEDYSEVQEYHLNKKSVSLDYGNKTSYTLADLKNSKPLGITRDKGEYQKGGKSVLNDIKEIMSRKQLDLE